MTSLMGIEDNHCFGLVEWAAWKNIFLVHIPNEGKRSVGGHIRQKKLGLQKGFPDYFLAEPTDLYPGMFFEMKSPGNKPSKEQINILTRLRNKGYFTAWYDSIDDAIIGIENYLKGST